MSVISCKQTFKNRSASDDAEYTRRLVREFVVVTSDPSDDADMVKNAGPALYERHPIDNGALCISREASQSDDPCVWSLVCTYSSKIGIPATIGGGSGGSGGSGGTGGSGGGSGSGAAQDPNPLNRGYVYEFSTETYQYAIRQDFTSPTPKSVTNSAWEPFDPPVEIERGRLVMTVTQNKPFYNPRTYEDLLYKCNDDTFLNFFEPYRCLFVGHQANSLLENDIFYWQIKNTYRLGVEWNRDFILDEGYRHLVYDDVLDSYSSEVILDDAATPLSKPSLLDGEGEVLGDSNSDGIQDDPVFLEFTFYPAADFTELE